MVDEVILRAEPRTVLGKKVKRLRREGLVPGVVYGPVLNETVSVSVNRRDFEKFFARNGHSTIVSLTWEGGQQPVLIREVQIDPVTRVPLHIDFFAPNMRQKLRQAVPLVLHNPNEDMVGVLQTILTEIEVEALPADLPHQIDLDIHGLVEVGDTVHVSDLSVPGNVEIITDAEELVASIVAETVEEEPEVEEAAEAEGEEAAGEEAAEAIEGEDGDGGSSPS
jgi:large subunit ribosomal protein L25